MGVYRQDIRTQDWLRAAGYRTRHHLHPDADRLRPETGRRIATPATDVVVRRVTDEADLRVAHDIEEESFLEHYGNVPISFESWLERLTERGDDYAQVYLAYVDGAPVGLLDQQPGLRAGRERRLRAHPRRPARRPRPRGRHGVAARLLRPGPAARDGTAVLLHVDVANVTGALRLYESVGMRAVLEIDAWAKGERVG